MACLCNARTSLHPYTRPWSIGTAESEEGGLEVPSLRNPISRNPILPLWSCLASYLAGPFREEKH